MYAHLYVEEDGVVDWLRLSVTLEFVSDLTEPPLFATPIINSTYTPRGLAFPSATASSPLLAELTLNSSDHTLSAQLISRTNATASNGTVTLPLGERKDFTTSGLSQEVLFDYSELYTAVAPSLLWLPSQVACHNETRCAYNYLANQYVCDDVFACNRTELTLYRFFAVDSQNYPRLYEDYRSPLGITFFPPQPSDATSPDSCMPTPAPVLLADGVTIADSGSGRYVVPASASSVSLQIVMETPTVAACAIPHLPRESRLTSFEDLSLLCHIENTCYQESKGDAYCLQMDSSYCNATSCYAQNPLTEEWDYFSFTNITNPHSSPLTYKRIVFELDGLRSCLVSQDYNLTVAQAPDRALH